MLEKTKAKYEEMNIPQLKEEMNRLSARSHFLLRAFEHKNVSPCQQNENGMSYQEELDLVDNKIRVGTTILLKRLESDMIKETKEAKTKITSDGDLKRELARIIINMLEPVLNDDELKGCFRQGYKLMRNKVK